MANEITLFYESGLNTYAIIRNSSGQAWDTAGAAFEAWNAMSDYDIALTDKSGSMYLGDFPAAIPAGYYTIQKFQRAGESPADTDPCVEAEYGYWTGSIFTKIPYALQSIISTIANILIDTNEVQTDLTNGGRLDLLIDAIKAKTDNLPASPAAIGSAMTLADDAITSAKFDETTAFPIKSADTGSTKIARTGADNDTLETLSDEIATIAAATPVNLVMAEEFVQGS